MVVARSDEHDSCFFHIRRNDVKKLGLVVALLLLATAAFADWTVQSVFGIATIDGKQVVVGQVIGDDVKIGIAAGGGLIAKSKSGATKQLSGPGTFTFGKVGGITIGGAITVTNTDEAVETRRVGTAAARASDQAEDLPLVED